MMKRKMWKNRICGEKNRIGKGGKKKMKKKKRKVTGYG
jgi:hypothetical protein